MGLTDPGLLWLLAALTLLAFMAAVLLTPRMRGHWAWAFARAGVILLAMTTGLLITGAYLNDANGWYVSWSDLAGASGSQQEAVQGAGPATSASGTSAAAGRDGSAAALAPLPQPGQRLQTYLYRGPRSTVRAQILVYLPASYQDPSAVRRRYPVVEALHGSPGSPSGWTKTMGIGTQLDGVVAAHRIGETIVVVPQVNTPLGKDGECVDGPSGSPQLETWLTVDVPAFVTSHFRTTRDRSGWATMGYSAGGWCAAMAGVLHPDTFGAAVALSGYFSPDFAGGPPWPAGSPRARRYDLTSVVRAHPPAVAVWLQAGKLSPYWPQTQRFLGAVRAPMSVTTVIQPDTGHRWQVWKAQVPVALAWLGSHLPGFAPGG